ncbi:InlB B-repeat-containing protein, partial [Caldisericum sp.]|uniref:InlB B-repeat-containing protein n=1 Tax=Caldisericum sp. TaxID=2499687 RepID=UPI003D0D5A1E
FNQSNASKFSDYAKSLGFDVQFLNSNISTDSLSNVGVLISGSAWRDINDSEILAIKDFVNNGGILLLAGLGWSWITYHPDKTLDDLPANKIGKEFGIKWSDGVITETKDFIYNDTTVFVTLYPESLFGIYRDLISNSLKVIEDILNANKDLNKALSNSEELRNRWVCALETLYGEVNRADSVQKEIAFNRINAIINKYPYYFKKDHSFNENSENFLIWSREKIAVIFYGYAIPLNDEKKNIISNTLNLEDTYLNIWNKFGILVLDNNKLYQKNLQFIFSFFDSLPAKTHNLKLIMIGKLLGKPIDGMYLLFQDEKYMIYDLGASFATTTKIGYAIDLWDIHIDGAYENPFPADVPERKDPYFAGALAHETTHIIDFNLILSDSTLRKEREKYLNRASNNHLNYLRSANTEDGFFIKNPLEFIASIGNQWFCDTWNTLDLAIKRFEEGYKEPINQFLFFARALSLDTNVVPFYYREQSGTKLLKTDVYIVKDLSNRIVKLFDTRNKSVYDFVLDSQGAVSQFIKSEFNYESSKFVIDASAVGSGGTIFPSGRIELHLGESATFTVTLNEGYKIKDIKADGVSVDKSLSYTFSYVTSNHSIEVTFEPIICSIYASAGSSGSIYPSENVFVDYGKSQAFSITPNAGYKIKDVKVDGVSVGAVSSYTFENITKDHTIEAIFEPITFTITSSSSSGGTITPSSTITVNYGDSKTFNITPNP